MSQTCDSCGAVTYGHPTYSEGDDVKYRFNCPECGNMWTAAKAH